MPTTKLPAFLANDTLLRIFFLSILSIRMLKSEVKRAGILKYVFKSSFFKMSFIIDLLAGSQTDLPGRLLCKSGTNLLSGDRETYKKKFRELLEKEEIKVYGKKIE